MHAKLQGEFFIVDEQLDSTSPPVEGVRRLEISPEFGPSSEWTGVHKLEAVISIDNNTDGPLEPHLIYERGKDLVDKIVALATLSLGWPVRVRGGVSLKRRIADSPPKYRFIAGAMKAKGVVDSAQLSAKWLSLDVDAKTMRVIRWWARGLSSDDGIDRLIAFNNALDLLAGIETGAPGRVRICKNCGWEEKIGPGLRERVTHLLSDILGYDRASAEEVYESRIDLAHARSDLDAADLRKFRLHADMLAKAIRKGIARILRVELPPSPKSLPIDLPSSLLDIEYEEGNDNE